MVSWSQAKALALALPEAAEADHFGSPSFRVRGKIFMQLSSEDETAPRATLKLAAADQSALLMTDPETFVSVPGWGKHGWTWVYLHHVDEGLFAGLLRQAWKQVAPKKLVAETG